MAKALNKSRIRDSKIILISTFILVFVARSFIPPETAMHEIVEYIGYFLVAICALGRVYSTGGIKTRI